MQFASDRHPGAKASIYLLALFAGTMLPWIIFGIQEKIRYGADPHLLWPWITLSTFFHAAALCALIAMPDGAGFQRLRAQWTISTQARRTLTGGALIAAGLLLSLALINTYYYLEMLWREPISPFNGDMLPLIQMSLRDFWANHRYPYHFYDVAHWQIPLTYFPGVWLPFTLPWGLGVDIRFLQAPCYLAMTALLVAHSVHRITRASDWFSICEAIPPALIGIYLFQIPAFRGFLPALHLIPFWLFTACWAIYFLQKRWFVSGLFLGLCAISRPYLIAVAPVLLIWCAWNWRNKRHGVIAHCMGAAIPCALFGAPFFLANPHAFLYGVLEWYDFASQYHLQSERWRTHGFGFSGLLWELSGAQYGGIFVRKMTVTWIAEAVLLGMTWRRVKTNAQMLRVSAAAIFVMLYFTVIPFYYTFACPLILLALAQSSTVEVESPRAYQHWLRWGFASLFTLVLAIILFHALFQSPLARDVNGLNGKLPLTRQVKLIAGFNATGWAGNDANGSWQFVAPHAYAGLPVLEASSPALYLHYELVLPADDAALDVYLNGELLGAIPLHAQAGGPAFFAIPRANLFRGTNLLRFEARSGDVTMSEEQVQSLGVVLRQVTLAPEPELRMELSR